MSEPVDLFDFARSRALKDEGRNAAAFSRAELLDAARSIARRLAIQSPQRVTNADAVGREWKRLGYPDLGPAAGSIFKGKEWKFTGRRIRSSRVSNHARELKVWELQI